MEQKTTKVAVIGTGSMGKNHIRVFSELESVQLVGICDTNLDAMKNYAQQHGCNGYSNLDEMLEEEKPDAVSIAVPTKLHKQIALACINKGVHVLVEKPIAPTPQDAQEMIDAAREKDVILMVGHIERFNPAIRELKKRLDNNELGKVYKIKATRVGPFPQRIRDVGVIQDLAVHDIDIMRYLTGSNAVRLFAETAQKIHTNNEDLLSGLIRFSCGTLGVLSVNWLTPTKIRELAITGEKGMFVANYITQELVFYENAELKKEYTYSDILRGVSEGTMTKFNIAKAEPLKEELKHFVTCIQNNEQPLITGVDGKHAVVVAQGLLESSAKSMSITFD